MTRVQTVPIFLGCLLFLSACNTTDALTPQVDIGSSSSPVRSSPVTQREAERLASEPARQPEFSQSADNYETAYSAPDRRPVKGAAPTTMEDQARAVDSASRSPARSIPIGGDPDQPTLSNAQAEEEDMGPQSSALPPEAAEPATPPPPGTQMAALPPASASASAARGNTVRFLPIIGAPVQAVTPLSRQLGAEARAHGLSIKKSSDSSSDYILKGYLSAFSDSGNVTVAYVWDILDNGGGRLYRIQGEEVVPSAAADPWVGVPASVMQQIGTKTIAEFTRWRQTKGG